MSNTQLLYFVFVKAENKKINMLVWGHNDTLNTPEKNTLAILLKLLEKFTFHNFITNNN